MPDFFDAKVRFVLLHKRNRDIVCCPENLAGHAAVAQFLKVP